MKAARPATAARAPAPICAAAPVNCAGLVPLAFVAEGLATPLATPPAALVAVADIEADTGADMEADMAADIEADIAADMEADIEADMEAGIEADIEADIEGDIEALAAIEPFKAGLTPNGWSAPHVAPIAVGQVELEQTACSWAPCAGMTVAGGAHL